jgi:hypothetical protein
MGRTQNILRKKFTNYIMSHKITKPIVMINTNSNEKKQIEYYAERDNLSI